MASSAAPPLVNRLDYQNPFLSLMTTYTFIPTSTTIPILTGRANSALSTSSPLPSGLFCWDHLHHRRTAFWATSPRPGAHFFRESLPSPLKASYIPPTTTPSFSSTDRTRLHRAKPLRRRPRLPHLPLTVFDPPNIGGHRSFNRDHLACIYTANARTRLPRRPGFPRHLRIASQPPQSLHHGHPPLLVRHTPPHRQAST